MNTPQTSGASEINRLYTTVITQTDASRMCLHAALLAAWQAGRLLLTERARIRRTMGAAWGLWLKAHMPGTLYGGLTWNLLMALVHQHQAGTRGPGEQQTGPEKWALRFLV